MSYYLINGCINFVHWLLLHQKYRQDVNRLDVNRQDVNRLYVNRLYVNRQDVNRLYVNFIIYFLYFQMFKYV